MLRIRLVTTLLAALALVGAACGGGDADTTSDQQPEAEAAVTTPAGPDDSPETGGTEASDPDAITDGGEPDAGDGEPDEASAADGRDPAAPVDADALLASATTVLDGRSVRGEASVELAPGFEFSTSFESDADGDLAVSIELPPGMDPEFPGGADAEMRYVGGVVYVRPPAAAETLAGLGVDEAWYVAEPVPGADPMSDAMGSAGVMCAFPQMLDAPPRDCDLLGETGAFLEAASAPEIVGREDVRGVDATRVRFQVSLLDLMGEALGMEPDDGETSEAGAFDDTASDPFAEGMDQIFGFLDAGFEVDVWIDDESLIRRLTFDLASMFAGLAGEDAGAGMPSSLLTLEFFDFDADISVDAPPPEAIVDEDLLVGGDDYATSEEYEPYDDYDDYDDDYS